MGADDNHEVVFLCDQLTGLFEAPTPAERTMYILDHPVLLSGAAHRVIQLARPEDERINRALAFLDSVRKQLWTHPEQYPGGHGPLERVIAGLRNGDLDLADAVDRATAPECAGQLSHTYLRALLSRLLEEAREDLTFALGAGEAAMEAAWAMPWPRLAVDVRRGAAEGFVRLVHFGLTRRPDGRLYARAMEVGEWCAEEARESGIPHLQGTFLHWIGTTSLDAYGANFGPSPEFLTRIQEWLARASDPMPEPAEGLARARRDLEAAVDLREPGSERGQTLKALVETMVYEGYAGGPAHEPARIVALADRALADLNPEVDRGTIERVVWLRDLIVG
jgi:hypothetical protein